jgi:hypothetical protein
MTEIRGNVSTPPCSFSSGIPLTGGKVDRGDRPASCKALTGPPLPHESQKASPVKAQSPEPGEFFCDSGFPAPPERIILLSGEVAYENSEPREHQRENSQSPHPKNSLSTQLQNMESPHLQNSYPTQLQNLESPLLKNSLPTQLQTFELSQQNSKPEQLQNNESSQLENSMSSQLENKTSTKLQNSNTFLLQNSTPSEQLEDIPASPPQNNRSIRSQNSQSSLTQKNETSPSEDRNGPPLLENSKTSPQNSELRQPKNSQFQSDYSDEFRDSLEDANAEGESLEEDKNNKVVDLKPLDVEGESIDGKSRALKRSIHTAEDFVTKVS